MNSKLKSGLKKIPLAAPAYQFLRTQGRLAMALYRRAKEHRSFSRGYFESLFENKLDPWNYAGPHQQERLRLLLQQVPQEGRLILETGCAEGAFTAVLAERVQTLIAADISAAALVRAKNRCRPFANVSFVQADLLYLPFRSVFDVIICAGILGYFPEPALFYGVGDRIQDLLVPGGHLILENRWETGDGGRSGKSIHEHFATSPRLKLCNLLRKDEYGIGVFQRI